MASDNPAAASESAKTSRLIDALHLQPEGDGATIIDDRTLSAAHLNQAARVLLEALREPRTDYELVTILADAASCARPDAVAPVARLMDELSSLGWLESSDAE